MFLRQLVPVTIALLAVAGCGGTSGNSSSSSSSSSAGTSSAGTSSGGGSSSVSCVNDLCQVEVAGDTSGKRLGVLGRELRIGPIETSAVTVSVGDDRARIVAGETATVGTLEVRVLSAGGQKASLEVRRG